MSNERLDNGGWYGLAVIAVLVGWVWLGGSGYLDRPGAPELTQEQRAAALEWLHQDLVGGRLENLPSYEPLADYPVVPRRANPNWR